MTTITFCAWQLCVSGGSPGRRGSGPGRSRSGAAAWPCPRFYRPGRREASGSCREGGREGEGQVMDRATGNHRRGGTRWVELLHGPQSGLGSVLRDRGCCHLTKHQKSQKTGFDLLMYVVYLATLEGVLRDASCVSAFMRLVKRVMNVCTRV